MSGYYLDCLDKKYSKKVKLFDKLEDFRDSLINELDYIENINENVLIYEIDMSTFNQKEFDEFDVNIVIMILKNLIMEEKSF